MSLFMSLVLIVAVYVLLQSETWQLVFYVLPWRPWFLNTESDRLAFGSITTLALSSFAMMSALFMDSLWGLIPLGFMIWCTVRLVQSVNNFPNGWSPS